MSDLSKIKEDLLKDEDLKKIIDNALNSFGKIMQIYTRDFLNWYISRANKSDKD